MISSAKLYAVTFLAASALGVAVLVGGGCTVTSGPIDDTDGGSSGSSGTSGTSGSSGTTDSGSDVTVATCDNPNQKPAAKFSAACQACLEAKCCSELKTCYAIPDPGDTKLDCNEVTTCISDCRKNNPVGADGDAAAADTCSDDCVDDLTTADGVKDAYNAIIACTGTQCNSECE